MLPELTQEFLNLIRKNLMKTISVYDSRRLTISKPMSVYFYEKGLYLRRIQSIVKLSVILILNIVNQE